MPARTTGAVSFRAPPSSTKARNSLARNGSIAESNEPVSLMAVVSGVAGGTNVSLRCTEQAGENLQIEDAKITALQVRTITGD